MRPAQGETPIWSQDLGTADDTCRRPRRDYYINYRLTLPGAEILPPGSYRLLLIQKDALSGRAAQRETTLSIAAPTHP